MGGNFIHMYRITLDEQESFCNILEKLRKSQRLVDASITESVVARPGMASPQVLNLFLHRIMLLKVNSYILHGGRRVARLE